MAIQGGRLTWKDRVWGFVAVVGWERKFACLLLAYQLPTLDQSVVSFGASLAGRLGRSLLSSSSTTPTRAHPAGGASLSTSDLSLALQRVRDAGGELRLSLGPVYDPNSATPYQCPLYQSPYGDKHTEGWFDAFLTLLSSHPCAGSALFTPLHSPARAASFDKREHIEQVDVDGMPDTPPSVSSRVSRTTGSEAFPHYPGNTPTLHADASVSAPFPSSMSRTLSPVLASAGSAPLVPAMPLSGQVKEQLEQLQMCTEARSTMQRGVFQDHIGGKGGRDVKCDLRANTRLGVEGGRVSHLMWQLGLWFG